jgi:hypothetical protein
VVLAPSERSIVDVLVERPGELHLEHHTPDRVYRLAAVAVAGGPVASTAAEFPELRRAPELEAERRGLDRWLAAPPDKVLALVAQLDDPAALPADAGPVTYARARTLPATFDSATRRSRSLRAAPRLAITDEASPFARRVIVRGEQCARAPLIQNDQARSSRHMDRASSGPASRTYGAGCKRIRTDQTMTGA